MKRIYRVNEDKLNLSSISFPPIVIKKKVNQNFDVKSSTQEKGKLTYETIKKEVLEKTKSEVAILKNEAKLEIERMKKEAVKEVELMKLEAKKKIEEGMKEGYAKGFSNGQEEGFKKGYQDGFESGKKESLQKLIDFLNILDKSAKEISNFKENVIRESENEIAKMSLSIAKKVINRELLLDPSVVIGVIRDALNKVYYKKKFIIYVNPLDLELVKKEQEKLTSILENFESFVIKPSTQVEPGGCIVETESGTVDARLESKYEKVKESVIKAIGEENQ